MSIAEACHVLGVHEDAGWNDIRVAYRRRIRAAHPDLSNGPDATATSARLNLAYRRLEEATAGGARALSDGQGRVAAPEVSAGMVLRTRPGDVFVQLLEAAHDLGEVSYIDPEAGLIQLLLSDGGPASSQLLIALDVDTDPVSASFTLDSMDEVTAPDIHEVVRRLGRALADVEG